MAAFKAIRRKQQYNQLIKNDEVTDRSKCGTKKPAIVVKLFGGM
jgi:hypothetical protein